MPDVYDEFVLQREEILRHKWLLSEEAGRDIGFEAALVDWIVQHKDKWLEGREGNQRPDQR